MNPKEISETIFHLAECPLWNPIENKFYWTDILEGEIWSWNPGSEDVSMVWKGDMQIGGFAFTRDNNLILCTEKGVYKLLREQTPIKLKEIMPLPLEFHERCNDITIDPEGRLIIGTKHETTGKSNLFIVEKGLQPRQLLNNLGLSNGMAFSTDLKYFFHTDSSYFKITRYRYTLETGDISNPEIFFLGTKSLGFPDGITIDSEDHLWVAFWGTSKIRRIAPDRTIVAEIEVPALQPSSLAFGGKYMNDLLITTACEGYANRLEGTDSEGNFLGGKIYSITLPVHGRQEWFASL